MTNGEIAYHEQFRHLSICFQKSSAAEASERVYIQYNIYINLYCIKTIILGKGIIILRQGTQKTKTVVQSLYSFNNLNLSPIERIRSRWLKISSQKHCKSSYTKIWLYLVEIVAKGENVYVLRNFSFCQDVFKSCLLQIRQNMSASGKVF